MDPRSGYLRAGVFYNKNGIYGLHGPAEIMPRF